MTENEFPTELPETGTDLPTEENPTVNGEESLEERKARGVRILIRHLIALLRLLIAVIRGRKRTGTAGA